jgi:hypothetical protein
MCETREFRARAGFAVTATFGYFICIALSVGYLAGRRWANLWPANVIAEAVSLIVSTWLVLNSYVKLWVGPDDIKIRLPRATRTIKWAELAAYELSGRGNSVCRLRDFEGTVIRVRFSSFESGEELAQLIDSLATKPV